MNSNYLTSNLSNFLCSLCRSSDGRILVASSTDGYCSLVSFAKGELGTPYIGKKNRDSEKYESFLRNSNKVTEHERADVEMEDVSKKPFSALLDESPKCEKNLTSMTLIEPSKKQDESQTPSRKESWESCSKQDQEGSEPSSKQAVELSTKQEKGEEHNRPLKSTAEEILPNQQEESKKPSSDTAQEPPNSQITVRRARDRCVWFHIVCMSHKWLVLVMEISAIRENNSAIFSK